MTAQIQDTISIEQQLYWIARSSNREGLFNPTDYGIQPVPASSACNRGFYCCYIITDRQLLVMDVNLTPNMSDRLKLKYQRIEGILCGKSPEISKSNLYIWQYRELFHPITYTGGLLVCNGSMNHDLDIMPGFPSIYLCGKVYEAIFEVGKLIQIVDHSTQIAQTRNSLLEKLRNKAIRENSLGANIDYSLYSILPQIEACLHFQY